MAEHHAKGKDAEHQDQLLKWFKQAEAVLNERAKFVVEASSEGAMVDRFKECVPLSLSPSGASVMALYEGGVAGESTSKPHLRPPALSKEHVRKLIGAFVAARSAAIGGAGPVSLQPCDVYVLTDAGKAGNESQLMAGFVNDEGRQLPKEKKHVLLAFTEESVRARREREKGTVQCVENMYLVSAKPLMTWLPHRTRLHFSDAGATNGSDWLGPMALPGLDDLWKLPWGQKKIYGPARRVLAGGPTEEPGDDHKKMKPRSDSDVEAVAFHTKTVQFYEELLHSYKVKALFILTGSDINPAIACLRKGVTM